MMLKSPRVFITTSVQVTRRSSPDRPKAGYTVLELAGVEAVLHAASRTHSGSRGPAIKTGIITLGDLLIRFRLNTGLLAIVILHHVGRPMDGSLIRLRVTDRSKFPAPATSMVSHPH